MRNKTLTEYWEEAKDIFQRRIERGAPEFPTGLNFLDEATDGLHRGEVWIIAGKSGGGKTSLGLQIARSFADNPEHSVLFLSLEMKGWELTTRMFCEMMNVDYYDFLKGQLPTDYKHKDKFFCDYIQKIDFEIFERGFTFDEVEKIISSAYQTKKPDVIFLDFMQLIEWRQFGDERKALMEYIRKMKELAKKLDVGIVVISQLRRPPSGSKSTPPDIIDLKGSGSLEQTADKVIIVYSEEYEDGNKNYFINLAKHRQGMTICKEVNFDGAHYRFVEKKAPPLTEQARALKKEFGGEVVGK